MASGSVNKFAQDRGGVGYVVFGRGDDLQVVVGEPGGEVFQTDTASSASDAESKLRKMLDAHYPEQPKDDGKEDAPRSDGLTGDPRETAQAPKGAQPTDPSGRPSGAADSAEGRAKAAKK